MLEQPQKYLKYKNKSQEAMVSTLTLPINQKLSQNQSPEYAFISAYLYCRIVLVGFGILKKKELHVESMVIFNSRGEMKVIIIASTKRD